MEDFSQSRGEDDLFDDEIVPIETPQEVEPVTAQLQETSLNAKPAAVQSHPNESRPARGLRGRGRGAHPRGGHNQNELMNSRYAPQPMPTVQTQQQVPSSVIPTETLNDTPSSQPSTTDKDSLSLATSNPPDITPTPAKPAAVRGDRTGTGGIKKPKLTEEELTAKLAAAKERSQTLSAAHARAQADAASFEERERVAQEKRAKDAANRKVMDNEREKNRARKMAVMGGREWDAEKNEEDFRTQQGGRGRGRSTHMRAMNGTTTFDRNDPALDDTRQYEWNEGRGRGRGRGRGDRGRGRGGRGGGNAPSKQPDLGAEVEFPALPASAKPKEDGKSTTSRPSTTRAKSDLLSPSGEGGTWADQVEMSEAAKAPLGGW